MTSLFVALALLASAALPAPAPAQAQSEDPSEIAAWDAEHYDPPALPLTGYRELLSGRLDVDGTLDTGMVRLRFVQGADNAPLDVSEVQYGKGPQLWARFKAKLGEVDFTAVTLAIAEHVGQDMRLISSCQVRMDNPTDAPRQVVLSAELLPSHESPVIAAVPFDATVSWAREGNLIVRGDQVAAGWVGPEPEVAVLDPSGSPDTPAVRFTWRLEIPAGGVKYVEVKVAGAPAGAELDEENWRERFFRRSYVVLEETLGFQGLRRGSISGFKSRSQMLKRVLVNGLHLCRMFGAESATESEVFTDNPYGQPGTDAAAAAEILACLVEYSMGEFTEAYLRRMVDDLPRQMTELDDDRKLAYVHALARAVRLSAAMAEAPAIAEAIVALGDPDVSVEPWHDPEVVRQDLLGIVSAMGLPTDGLMTRLRWADVEPDTTAAHMQAARRAIADREGSLAWTHMRELFAAADGNGMGSMDGGEMDARYSVAMLTIGRALLVDDHGEDLNLFPGGSLGIVDSGTEVDTTWLPTRFGSVKARAYHVGPNVFGCWTVFRESFAPRRVTVTVPDGLDVRAAKGGTYGGSVSLVEGEERMVELFIDPLVAQGIRFQIRLAQR